MDDEEGEGPRGSGFGVSIGFSLGLVDGRNRGRHVTDPSGGVRVRPGLRAVESRCGRGVGGEGRRRLRLCGRRRRGEAGLLECALLHALLEVKCRDNITIASYKIK
jgi:hypothetical protein